ncbi:helix-turn-helix transcriptional regulator [Streptomyces lydicus]|uniref:helix-turn-helix transcriptional regulator n=1 Tax=Streptomyces lydicus TaxID=47763 RepID=UPI0010106832|nr:response regulator transcription factor [Streptomyces lydicus]MCZ1007842.1 response regulator transcription factor [Streptomyces lydicus]
MSPHMLVDTVRVAIHAPEGIVRAGLVSYLQHDRELAEVSVSDVRDGDVVVVATDVADAAALESLGALSDAADVLFVLVVAKMQWRADISAAVDRGVRAVLWRDSFTPADFTRTLLAVAQGGGSFPASLQGTLMEQVQVTQREVLVPRGLAASGISSREMDVLRLVAEGEELSQIAAKLCYSERTIKYVLYGVMKRLRLRNRAHAVSYAIRSGLI